MVCALLSVLLCAADVRWCGSRGVYTALSTSLHHVNSPRWDATRKSWAVASSRA